MRTLDDLRAVFADLEAQAPAALPQRPLRSQRPQRTRRYAALVAAAVVIAAAVAVIATRSGTGRPQPARPAPTRCAAPAHCPLLNDDGTPVPVASEFRLDVKPGSGWVAYLRAIGTDRELLQLHRTAGQGDVSVERYVDRAAIPDYTRSGPAPVAGREAFFIRKKYSDRTQIEWTDGSADVIVSEITTTSDATLLAAARAVAYARRPARLPFRFGPLGHGLVPEWIAVTTEPGSASAWVAFTDGRPTQADTDPGQGGAVSVQFGDGTARWSARLGQTAQGVPIYALTDGSAAPNGGVAIVAPGQPPVLITVNNARLQEYAQADLVRIAKQVTLAPSVVDASTWFSNDLFTR